MSEFNRAFGTGLAVTALLLGGSACSSEEPAAHELDRPVRAPSSASSGNGDVSNQQNTQAESVLVARFDTLGNGSHSIEVFQGPAYTEYDQVSTGKFKDGDKLVAECVVAGRTVNSQPPEPPRQSGLWLRLAGPTEQYASVVYSTVNPKTVRSELPDCD